MSWPRSTTSVCFVSKTRGVLLSSERPSRTFEVGGRSFVPLLQEYIRAMLKKSRQVFLLRPGVCDSVCGRRGGGVACCCQSSPLPPGLLHISCHLVLVAAVARVIQVPPGAASRPLLCVAPQRAPVTLFPGRTRGHTYGGLN